MKLKDKPWPAIVLPIILIAGYYYQTRSKGGGAYDFYDPANLGMLVFSIVIIAASLVKYYIRRKNS